LLRKYVSIIFWRYNRQAGPAGGGEAAAGLKKQYKPDLVIANGENVAGGIGLTKLTAEDLMKAGVDVITSGNHIWAQKDIIPCLDSDMPIIRPMNYPPGLPGNGYIVFKNKVVVVNLIGRTFIGNFDCPFRGMDSLLEKLAGQYKIIIIDFHAEATSEKMALGRYLDGRVSAILGTHTHVGTIDSQILPQATAYVTDIGMTGPVDSVIGDDADAVIERFLSMIPKRLSVGKGKVMLTAMLTDIDDATGKARSIERITRR
jgi:metallophosphoesterase (TIGR00282 family)